jgi:hypothetical protein
MWAMIGTSILMAIWATLIIVVSKRAEMKTQHSIEDRENAEALTKDTREKNEPDAP